MYMEEIGDEMEAFYRYEQAINLYTEWGAKAKTEQLQPKIDSMKKKGISRSTGSLKGFVTR